jgi:hypothetical protein
VDHAFWELAWQQTCVPHTVLEQKLQELEDAVERQESNRIESLLRFILFHLPCHQDVPLAECLYSCFPEYQYLFRGAVMLRRSILEAIRFRSFGYIQWYLQRVDARALENLNDDHVVLRELCNLKEIHNMAFMKEWFLCLFGRLPIWFLCEDLVMDALVCAKKTHGEFSPPMIDLVALFLECLLEIHGKEKVDNYLSWVLIENQGCGCRSAEVSSVLLTMLGHPRMTALPTDPRELRLVTNAARLTVEILDETPHERKHHYHLLTMMELDLVDPCVKEEFWIRVLSARFDNPSARIDLLPGPYFWKFTSTCLSPETVNTHFPQTFLSMQQQHAKLLQNQEEAGPK